MRNLHSKTKTSRKPNSQVSRLEAIHRLVNRHPYRIGEVEQKLSGIKPGFLTPYCLVYFKYLNVRHHFNCYKLENTIEHLELANDLIDDMDATAYETGVKINNSEYHFTRAFVKFVLGTVSTDEYETPFIKSKAKRITDTALRCDPKSQKFLWLQNQLAA